MRNNDDAIPCPRCGKTVRVRNNGTLYTHGPRDNRCPEFVEPVRETVEAPQTADQPGKPSSYARRILAALQGKHIYAGTVPAHVKARRRAKNKVARKANTRRLINA